MRRILTSLVVLGALASAGAAAAMSTALPAVLPVEELGMAASAVALVSGACLFLRAKSGPVGATVAVSAAAILLGLAAWLGWARFSDFEREAIYFQGQDALLVGDIYWPTGRIDPPAAVLVHGSGEATRGEFAFYARQLAKRGIAVLSYDKRGSGASTGNLYDDGYRAYAADAKAAYEVLSKRSSKVGFIGYSEGEWTVPMAARETGAAFIAIVGASGLSPNEQVWEEMRMRLQSAGLSKDEVSEARRLHRQVSAFERTGTGRDELLQKIHQVSNEAWFGTAQDFPSVDDIGEPDEYRWWRAVMDTNPERLWGAVEGPVLVLKGQLDDRSSASLSEKRFRRLKPGSRFQILKGGDHMLLDRSHPLPTFAHGYFDGLAAWIRTETALSRRRASGVGPDRVIE